MIQCKHCGEKFVARAKHKEEPHVVPWPEVALRDLGISPADLRAPTPDASGDRTPDVADLPLDDQLSHALGGQQVAQPVTSPGTTPVPAAKTVEPTPALEQERARLSAALAESAKTTKALAEERDELRKRVDEASAAIERDQDGLAASLSNAIKQRDTARGECANALAELAATRAELAESKSLPKPQQPHLEPDTSREQLQSASAELTLVRQELEKTRTEIARARRENEWGQVDLESARNETSSALKELAAAQQERDRAIAELAESRTQHELALAAHASEHQELLAGAEGRHAQMLDENARQRLADQEQWDSERTALASRVCELEESVAIESRRRQEEENLRKAAETERDSHSEALELHEQTAGQEREHNLATVATLQDELEAARQAHQALRAEHHDAHARLTALGTVQAESEATRLAHETTRAERDEARARLTALEAAQDEWEATKQAHLALRAERDEARSQLEALEANQSDWEAIKQAHDVVRTQRDEARAQLAALQTTHAERNAAAKLAADRLQAEADRLIRERDEALTRAAANARDVERQENELVRLRQELDDMRVSHAMEQTRRPVVQPTPVGVSDRSGAMSDVPRRATFGTLGSPINSGDIAQELAEGLVAELTDTELPSVRNGKDAATSEATQRRIDDLTSALEQARADADQLRSTLTSLGIRFY
jgi:hypothetical protein